MAVIMLGLLGLSIILFLLSFFMRDPYKDLKNELDQFTIQQVQENYQMKKKLKILEEELLVSEDIVPSIPLQTHESISSQKDIHDIIKNQVWALAMQGKPIEQIAQQSSLSVKDVYGILKEYSERGKGDE
ncbi:hypothetical protein RCG23_19150 [Neobacillus sp. PS3-34]|uniref:hypothetical protein n=1 Tax=Neobacillus sp. PS3-34 TaxID=3070678 RepID=UPI0027E14C7B|nr:hypothetical protein [Neobacillus sp. PS3-34]WML47511.1 hypothetical protein RCG23_19150 [Neobacillus sp. PS3-34]